GRHGAAALADAWALAEELDRPPRPQWFCYGLALRSRRLRAVWRLAVSAAGARPLPADRARDLRQAARRPRGRARDRGFREQPTAPLWVAAAAVTLSRSKRHL